MNNVYNASGPAYVEKTSYGTSVCIGSISKSMDIIFAGLSYEMALVYLDEVIVLKKRNFDEYLKRLRLVLQRSAESRLKVKDSKCISFRKRVSFLGQIIFEIGVVVDPEKVRPGRKNERTVLPDRRQGLSRPCGLLSKIYSGFWENSKTSLQLTE